MLECSDVMGPNEVYIIGHRSDHAHHHSERTMAAPAPPSTDLKRRIIRRFERICDVVPRDVIGQGLLDSVRETLEFSAPEIVAYQFSRKCGYLFGGLPNQDAEWLGRVRDIIHGQEDVAAGEQ